MRESTSGTDERNENVAAWLGRVQDGAQVPSGQGFEFGDGDGADDDGEEVSDGGEGSVGTARESPLEEAYPIAQLRELRISQDEGKERDRASEGSATETLAEDPNGTVKDDVVRTAIRIYTFWGFLIVFLLRASSTRITSKLVRRSTLARG